MGHSRVVIAEILRSTFGRWTVLSYVGKSGHDHVFSCICSCGKTKEVIYGNLRKKKSLSCGCYSNDFHRERLTTHGKSKMSEYTVLKGIVRRCTDPSQLGFKNYGGRGITVCDEWIGDGGVEKFLAHVGKRPTMKHTIDRYPNNDGNYEPGNVRWATRKEQDRNKRNNHFYTHDGVSKTLADWADGAVCNKYAFRSIIKAGWPLELALSLPLGKRTRWHR